MSTFHYIAYCVVRHDPAFAIHVSRGSPGSDTRRMEQQRRQNSRAKSKIVYLHGTAKRPYNVEYDGSRNIQHQSNPVYIIQTRIKHWNTCLSSTKLSTASRGADEKG